MTLSANPAPDASPRALPALSPEQAREMYHLAEEDYHVPLALMLEHGGRSLVGLAHRLHPGRGSVAVLAGKGWNGADALAAARHLLNAGWRVRVILAVPPETLHAFSWLQVQMLTAHGVEVMDARGDTVRLDDVDVIVDGLLGTNARGPPRPPMDTLIAAANASDARRVSLDVPTGVDPSTGKDAGDGVFRAEATFMLGIPKAATLSDAARASAGRLYLGDIGLPLGLYQHFGTTRPAFDGEGVLELE